MMAFVKADTAQYSCEIAGQVFQVLNIDIQEEMSDLFRIGLNLWLDNPEVAIAPMLRQPAKITITWEDKEKTYHGIVAGIRQTEAGRIGAVEQEYGHYAVEVVPNLWTLSHLTNCRIFQNLPVDEIITKVLGERCPNQQKEMKLQKSYEPREYCVQYRETDLAFISRLMEEEGIFYYFTHDGPEKMIIGDSPSAYGKCAPEDTAKYAKATGELAKKDEYFDQLTYEESVYSGKVKLKDFDYLKPQNTADEINKLLVEKGTGPHTDLEIHDFHPKRYATEGHGRTLATTAAEVQSAMRTVLEASGNWRSVSAGCVFTLEKAYRTDLDKDWVIISASHSASQVAGTDHLVSIVAIPADTVFRPLPVTPQPALNSQTATVVGPKGKEIYMDEHGRAKVQFHWDQEGKYDENTTCWIRVAQQYAGMNKKNNKKHGFHWHPLIEDEVIVDFLEGDPDNPIITGSVYNGDHTPLVKPEELIRNMVLTRYQHRLLFDDKNTSITLNTGGGELLNMVDKKEKEGKVILKTTGDEKIAMEDVNDSLGNCITLSTKDTHHMKMAEKDHKRGIQLATKEENVITMDDHYRDIMIQTKDDFFVDLSDKDERIILYTAKGQFLVLDDKKENIVVRTRKGHSFEISDKNKFIEISDSSGRSHVKIETSSGDITIESKKGSINIQSPNGPLNIDAQSIKMKAKADIEIDCTNLKIDAKASIKAKAGASFEVEAGRIKETAKADLTQKGLSVTSEAQTLHQVKGALVSAKASGIHTISGALVKIN